MCTNEQNVQNWIDRYDKLFKWTETEKKDA